MVQIYSFYFEKATFFRNFVLDFMRRLKKSVFLGLCGGALTVLATVRRCCPEVVTDDSSVPSECVAITRSDMKTDVQPEVVKKTDEDTESESVDTVRSYHPIRSVAAYHTSFPDVQDVQITAARKWGVTPVADRQEAETRKGDLVFLSSPYFDVDPRMTTSIPYLVPRANELLQHVGRTFLDSLNVKGVPLHKIIVSSVLRTEDDVRKLRARNGNASEQSCHRYGTTFDIAYNRYTTVSHPDGPKQRVVQNDTLKWVLSEVLRDARQEGLCYIKYEVRQGCFHVTVR